MRNLLIVLLLLPFAALSQQTEYGHWYGFEVAKDLPKGFDASVDGGLRYGYDGLILSSVFVDGALSYKVNKWLGAEAVVRYGARNHLKWGLQPRLRFTAGLRAKKSIGEVNLSYRVRVQSRPEGIFTENESLDFGAAMRHRVQANYKLMKKTWLVGDVEYFFDYYTSWVLPSDVRARIRVKRKLDKRLYANFGVLYQTELARADPTQEWVAQISFQWEWKRGKKKAKS